MRRAGRPASGTGRRASKNQEIVVGRNAVLEVLRAGRRKVWSLSVAEGARAAGALAEILAIADARQITVSRVARSALESGSGKAHGIAAEVDPYPYVALEDILDEADRRSASPLVLLLDVLQDPQNLGTLLRTAEAVGVSGVVLPLGRSAGVTPAVVGASSGASEHLLIAPENVAMAISRLQEQGIRVIGLESSLEAAPLDEIPLDGPLGLVVGSEGEGLRRLVRERCDALGRLPMQGRIGSLNAAVAGSIALFLAAKARGSVVAGSAPAP